MKARLLRPGALLAIAISLYVAVLAWTAPAVGYVRDEGYYFKAAELYMGWVRRLFSADALSAFQDGWITKFFSYNHEHPPLVKLAQGFSWLLFHEGLGWVSDAQGFRVAGFLFAGLSVWATYKLGALLSSKWVGLVAALMLISQPRYFFDAHLACFDVPVTAMWTFSIYAFLWAYTAPPERRSKRALVAGLVFGLGLATKLNVLFLPFLFVLWWLCCPTQPILPRFARAPGGGLDLQLPRVPVVLWACALIGPLVFYLTWPYLWHAPIDRTAWYIRFHLHHEHYPISYFHQLLIKPPFPWHFPLVMSLFTIPSPVLWLGSIGGLIATWRALKRELPALVLLSATALPVFLIAMPSTPIFGGVKHWYNALPSLCILAAQALVWALDWLRERWPRAGRALAPALVSLALLPGLFGIAASHPNGIGYYNELAGGYRGGAELGMQRGFWGGLAGPLYPKWLKDGGRVYFNRTNYDAYKMMRREGIIGERTRYENSPARADFGVDFIQPEHAGAEGKIWTELGTRPVDGVYQDNITLIQLYERGASARAPLTRFCHRSADR